MEEQQYQPIAPGDFVISADSQDYTEVPAGEPLKMHISKIETVKRTKWESDEEENVLSINFELDEDIEGKGQVYRGWYRPSLNPKAKLTPLINAVYGGNTPSKLDVTELVGLPLRVILTAGIDKKGDGRKRQYPETFLKPVAGQKKVTVEEGPVNVDDVFGPGVEEV